MEKLKYFSVVFTRCGRRNKGIDTRVGEAKAVVRELYRFVVTKREHVSFQLVFIPIIIYSHEASDNNLICTISSASGRAGA